MYSALWRIRAVVFLFVPFFSGTAAFPQAVNLIRHSADPLPLAAWPLGSGACFREAGSAGAVALAATAASRGLDSPCYAPPVSATPIDPCRPASLGKTGCPALRDPVQENLASMGKPGQKILRARERVLEILEGENGCSAWFREKDADPAGTFRTFSYEVDRKGEELVRESKGAGAMKIFRNPYVAKVIQANGRYATITINRNGAFFFRVAALVEEQNYGGAPSLRGARTLHVGPYEGETLYAQILALLHEFGHLVDLLPTDEGDRDGKSARNTNEVLRFCREDIESKVRRNTLSATR
jgi:hypothetical protein